MNLEDLKKWGEERDFLKKPLQLNQCEIIQDRAVFYNTHLNYLKAVQGKAKSRRTAFLPYYLRLLNFIELVEREE